MSTRRFQIRKCLNPACGLRYPVLEAEKLGTRCPICLGETKVISGATQETETPSAAESQRIAGPSILLDNIRSAWNTGSILRSAEGLGFSHAFLCGITPGPDEPAVRKTALGAERSVSWSLHRDAIQLIPLLRKVGMQILALEWTDGSIPLQALDLSGSSPESVVLVVGNEPSGIDPGILSLADRIVHLPMQGIKKSFNVAVAFGIGAYELGLRLMSQNAPQPQATAADGRERR